MGNQGFSFLFPFFDEVIENIDIGGPSMIRGLLKIMNFVPQ